MKLAVLCSLLAVTLAAPLAAHGPATPAAPVAAAKFTLDTPIEQIAADPAAKAALDASLPGTTTHPSYEMFKSMSLKQLQPMSDGKLSDEALAKAAEALAAVK